jgi:DNA repair exonuclease SbcCD ATPase subunit
METMMGAMATLAAGLGAIVAVAKSATKLAQEVEGIVGVFDRLADRQRTSTEIRTVRQLCEQVRRLTLGKADIGWWIEQYAENAAEYPEIWQDIQTEFRRLSEELADIREALLEEAFSRSALAAEMAVQADTAGKIFALLQRMPSPKDQEEMRHLREIGAVVRQIQASGIAALAKVDEYQAQLRGRLVGR